MSCRPHHEAAYGRRDATTGTTTSSLQSVTVLEVRAALDSQHGEAGVLFKDLEAATRSRLNYHGLTDALNALIQDGAATRVSRNQPASGSPTLDGRSLTSTDRSLGYEPSRAVTQPIRTTETPHRLSVIVIDANVLHAPACVRV